MPGDNSRRIFDRKKQYASVLMQQGRVQLDSDWNEAQRILRYRDETEAKDVIGHCGAPLHGGGFKITAINGGADLRISNGRIYVDGILCELASDPVPVTLLSGNQLELPSIIVDGRPLKSGHWIELFDAGEPPSIEPRLLNITDTTNAADNVVTVSENLAALQTSPPANLHIRRVATYLTQPEYPGADLPSTLASPPEDGVYLAYLDVWQAEITDLDDPRIREVALGGPDTSTRLKTRCQVRLLKVPDGLDPDCGTEFPEWETLTTPSSGRMNARTGQVPPDGNPCQLPPSAGYQRLENQLYRVEVHSGTNRSNATFKWSRDHSSVETAIIEISGTDGRKVEVSSLGEDEVLGFLPDQWVEIIDDEAELLGDPHNLAQIDSVSPGDNLIIFKTDISAFQGARKLRRWDQFESLTAAGVVEMTTADATGGWMKLEGGIEVHFDEGTYRPGDYWLIPARSVTGEIEWPPFEIPNSNPIPQLPFGITHHYCRLALILSGAYVQNFNGFPNGTTELGDGSLILSNNNVARLLGNRLLLTEDGVGGTLAAFKTPTLGAEPITQGITISFDYALSSQGTAPPADGFSINYGTITDGALAGEEGFGTGLSIEFDTWNNAGEGSESESESGIGIDVSVDGETVPDGMLRESLGADPLNNQFFNFDGAFHRVTIAWVPGAEGGDVTVVVDDNTLYDRLPTPGFAPEESARVAIGARTGGATERLLIGSIEIQPTALLTVLSDCRCRFPSLNQTPGLYYVSGDGQEVMPELPAAASAFVELPQPLVAGVPNPQCRDYPARVRFVITGGTGSLESSNDANLTGTSVTIPVDAEGLASCKWSLGANPANPANVPSQQVEAYLLDEVGDPVHLPIRYNASLSIASEVAYLPGNCPALSSTNTVQEALDTLCGLLDSPEDGIHITEVVLRNGSRTLFNDDRVEVDELLEGIDIECDRDVAPESIVRPTYFITLEMPLGVRDDPPLQWSSQCLGFSPLVLKANVRVEVVAGTTFLRWEPDVAIWILLGNRITALLDQLPENEARILARLTLKGNFIFTPTGPDDDPDLYLDGEVFGRPGPGGELRLRLPRSGNGRRGGDFEMWFWLARPANNESCSLVGHYRLDELPETDVMIDSAFGRDGIYTGTFTLGQASLLASTPPRGTSVRFEAGQGQVDSNTLALEDPERFTISLWLMRETLGGQLPQVIFAHGEEGATSPVFALLIGSNQLNWIVDDQIEFETDFGGADEIFHLAFTHNRGTNALYINGTQFIFSRGNTTVSLTEGILSFAAFNMNLGLIGRLDDIQIYAEPLTPDQILWLFGNPGRNCPPLVGSFFDDFPFPIGDVTSIGTATIDGLTAAGLTDATALAMMTPASVATLLNLERDEAREVISNARTHVRDRMVSELGSLSVSSVRGIGDQFSTRLASRGIVHPIEVALMQPEELAEILEIGSGQPRLKDIIMESRRVINDQLRQR